MVENGMLKRLIGGRYPAAGAPRATGHSMIQERSTVGNNKMSIIHVTCSKTIPQSKIKARLISEAKKAGLDHTYMLRNIEYNCYILTRIDVKTGQETVINADIPAFERRELMHVITASREEEIQSSIYNDNTLTTMIAPESMILESVEMNIKKPTKAQEFQLINPACRSSSSSIRPGDNRYGEALERKLHKDLDSKLSSPFLLYAYRSTASSLP